MDNKIDDYIILRQEPDRLEYEQLINRSSIYITILICFFLSLTIIGSLYIPFALIFSILLGIPLFFVIDDGLLKPHYLIDCNTREIRIKRYSLREFLLTKRYPFDKIQGIQERLFANTSDQNPTRAEFCIVLKLTSGKEIILYRNWDRPSRRHIFLDILKRYIRI